MNKATRMLAVTGMALFAGLTFGAAPAMASSSSSATTSTAKQASSTVDRTVGYYPTRWACELAGERGQNWGRWDDYDCYRARWGFHRGGWVLEVSYGWSDWNDWNGWDHRGHHRGHWFPGGDRHWFGDDHRGHDHDRGDGDRSDGDRGDRGDDDGDRGDGDN